MAAAAYRAFAVVIVSIYLALALVILVTTGRLLRPRAKIRKLLSGGG